MTMNDPLQATVDALASGQRFLIAAHEGPDGDAMSSTLALTNALREMGKDVVAYNVDGVPDKFCFLPGADTVVSEIAASEHFDVIVILDAGELRRARLDARNLCTTLINIDHHPFSEDFGDIYLVDDKCSATAAMLYRVLMACDYTISTEVALCIYTGILSDTGSFRYSSADPEAFAVAGEMVALGVDPWMVAGGLYESQEVERLQLLGMSLNTLRVSDCRQYAAMTVTQQMLDELGIGPDMADSFVNYPRSIHGVEVALFFRELDQNSYKLGMRSKGTVDVGALARELGGGGHHNAAGAVLHGTLDEVHTQVFERLGAFSAAQ
ncbi:DHH family phosphoesterase [Desulfuromonas acetoxidans]|uniref:Phosphoesterase, RecJ-like n=1 Tax=Desulfuromonas acetoxidans (strain DSM 684 / 11070) TaxID=281689 RepID=Q1K0G3_DESA6|nr:bifunctional oligoribonuclease/PAP phosphatase NrnA [Desulfuromonas acetoxidans]EAT15978.1 phosphoesterase, RecJ-like [Desulfuromonas acetoxidans DSM 684]